MLKSWFSAKCISATTKMRNFVRSERGDTNFISILIILGIVILLAGIFIGFKDKIVAMVQDIIDGFTL